MQRSLARIVAAVAASMLACVASAEDFPGKRAAHLTQAPFIMRLSKDEFRIAFGIDAPGCTLHGCSGVIRYRVDWRTEDGTVGSEIRRVRYSVPPRYRRAMTVDRQYFDTAEGAHTIELMRLTVADITCEDGALAAAPRSSPPSGEL